MNPLAVITDTGAGGVAAVVVVRYLHRSGGETRCGRYSVPWLLPSGNIIPLLVRIAYVPIEAYFNIVLT